jgi:hypothetical protein
MTLLPLIFLRTTIGFLRNRPHLAIFTLLVFISTFFGSNNERLMAPSFIVFYGLIASILQERLRTQTWVLVVLSFCAVLSSLSHQWMRFQLPDRQFTIALSLGALAMASAMVISQKVLIAGKHND